MGHITFKRVCMYLYEGDLIKAEEVFGRPNEPETGWQATGQRCVKKEFIRGT